MHSLIRPFVGLVAVTAALVLAGCSGSSADDGAVSQDDELASCSNASEVFLWSSRDSLLPVGRGLTPNAKCTQYYMAIPLVANDKTRFHDNVAAEIAQVHKLGSNFHAVAEFNFGAWSQWIALSPGTRDWRAAGLEFRHRMQIAGFELKAGSSDSWLVQELPSTLINSHDGIDKHDVRAHVVTLVKALAEGDGSITKMGGLVRAGDGQTQTNPYALPGYKGYLEDLLTDQGFWNGIRPYVRWWGEEVYADAHDVCVNDPSVDVAVKASHVNDYVFHLPRLAAVGPAEASAARSFLDATFTPWLNAAWNADVGYGDNRISSDEMQQLISLEVYSARAWQKSHPGAVADHVAFAWVPIVATDAEKEASDEQAARLSSAIDESYGKGQGASYACSPSGAYTYCACRVPGAAFTESWHNVFATW